jgi:integrase/recombinase XerD
VTRSQTPPKQMAKKLVRLLRVERPDYQYLKKVFQHTRSILAISPAKMQKRLPELLTDHELVGFYEAVWHARNPTHMIMIKLVLSRCTKLGGYGRKAAIFD